MLDVKYPHNMERNELPGLLSGGDPNTKAHLEGTPAEKHNKAAQDSESKQKRVADQESHPVSPPHL